MAQTPNNQDPKEKPGLRLRRKQLQDAQQEAQDDYNRYAGGDAPPTLGVPFLDSWAQDNAIKARSQPNIDKAQRALDRQLKLKNKKNGKDKPEAS